MNKPKKKVVWQQYVGTVFSMLIGAICGYAMIMFINNFSDDTSLYIKILSLVGLFLGMFVAFFFHMLIHEAGHLVFGLMTGYKFSSFRIASFMWLKESGKLKLKRVNVAGTGGQCLMIPPEMSQATRHSNMAWPSRTMVAPSSAATMQSPDIPMERTGCRRPFSPGARRSSAVSFSASCLSSRK